MTKKLFFVGLAVMALLATVSLTMAQPGGGPGQGGRGQGGAGGRGQGGPAAGGMMMGGGGAMGILFNEEARKELGITDEQAQKLRDASRTAFEGMARPQEGQRPDPAQMREQMQKMQDAMRKNLEANLSSEQVAKLDVMTFQRSGGLEGPMVNAESLRALNLTDDQKAKLQAAQEKRMEAMAAMRPAEGTNIREMSQDERAAFIAKMQEAGQKANEAFQAELKSILTAEQVAKAESLMKNVPEYLQQRAPAGRTGNREGGGLNWTPGQGTRGENPNREQPRERGNRGNNRQFPG